jgi:hypothetical protein
MEKKIGRTKMDYIIKKFKTFELNHEDVDPYGEEDWEDKNRFEKKFCYVSIYNPVIDPEKVNNFRRKIERDGFEVIETWHYIGVLFVKNNGRIQELENYPEVRRVEMTNGE